MYSFSLFAPWTGVFCTMMMMMVILKNTLTQSISYLITTTTTTNTDRNDLNFAKEGTTTTTNNHWKICSFIFVRGKLILFFPLLVKLLMLLLLFISKGKEHSECWWKLHDFPLFLFTFLLLSSSFFFFSKVLLVCPWFSTRKKTWRENSLLMIRRCSLGSNWC